MTTAPDDSLPIRGLVLVHEREVYGTVKHYPANQLAARLAVIAGSTTLTPKTIEHAKAMGLTVRTIDTAKEL
jgi:hypothetical protein